MKKRGWWFILGPGLLFAGLVVLGEYVGMLRVGDPAPRFTATLASGERFSLADELGKRNVVLFFYPADFTPGCTKEVCAYRDRYAEFGNLNAAIFGISGNDDSSHARFAGEYHLPFPLIADRDRSLAKAFHVMWLGGLVPFSKRITFVIDKQGVIRLAAHHEFAIDNHVEEAVAVLQDLERANPSR